MVLDVLAVKNVADFISECVKKVTVWGKKKGALMSAQKADDAEEVKEMVLTLQQIMTAVMAFSKYWEDKGRTNAQAYVVACKDVTDMPAFMKLHRHVAEAVRPTFHKWLFLGILSPEFN